MELSNLKNEEGCYLLQTELDKVLNNNRYKIGRSDSLRSRLTSETSYRHANIISVMYGKNSTVCEKHIINTFSDKYESVRFAESGSYGNEYFEGDINAMKIDFEAICNHFLKISSAIIENDNCYVPNNIILDSVETSLKYDNNEEYVKFTYGKFSLIKLWNCDLFQYKAITSAFSNVLDYCLIDYFYIDTHIATYEFYLRLCYMDNTLPKYFNIYIKKGNECNTVVIGVNFELDDDNYNDYKDLISIIPVENDLEAEQKLIQVFDIKLEKMYNKTYKYNRRQNVAKIFNSAISKWNRVSLNLRNTKHFHDVILNGQILGYHCSSKVLRLLIDDNIEDPKLKKDYSDMMNVIESYIKRDSYAFVQTNHLLKQNCLYWLFHKYIVIQNNGDLMVNGSKLWNSICETENRETLCNELSKFLQSRRIQRIKEQFEITYPNEIFYTEPIKNKEQPQFNGIYVHYILVHFIVEYLDAKHALIVAKLMYKRFKLNWPLSDNDINEETPDEKEYIERYKENLHSMKDLISFKAIMNI